MDRKKTVTVYEKTEDIVDVATGEILRHTSNTVKKTSAEPEFIKLYYQTYLAFANIKGVPATFLMSISRHMDWTNEGSPMYITLNRRVKEEMVKDCDVSMPQINRYITACKQGGILFKTEYRGVYELNPYIIAKGRWESIKELRTEFAYRNGGWKRTIELAEDPEPEENENE